MQSLFKVIILAISWLMPILSCLFLLEGQEAEAKAEIAELLKARANSSILAQQAELSLQLAKRYDADQQQENAFRTFLEAIKFERFHSTLSTEEEVELYDSAFKLYLTAHGPDVESVSRSLIDRYQPILRQSPHFHLLGFVVAAAYANLGDFQNYFEIQYSAYCAYPDHYFVHKARAILHLKLFERSPQGKEKEAQRMAMLEELDAAAKIYPGDSSLYRLMIAYAEESDKKRVVRSILNRIIDGGIVVPRIDLEFYLQAALGSGDFEITQQFIDCTKQWYGYSRVIAAAEESLGRIRLLGRKADE